MTGLYVFTAAPSQAALSDYAVGSAAGHLDIGADGQATWSLAITVPPGVNGLSPKLSIHWSSTAGNGLLGQGGYLGGLSSMTRCAATFATDGYARGPRLTEDDPYCLDGSRLQLISGSQGGSGSEYHTEVESFQKITAVGSTGAGPDSFVVQTRNGSRLTYGGSEDARLIAPGSGTVAEWRLSQLEDANGNRIYYHYANLGSETVAEWVPSSITYGGSANAQVTFIYETRPDVREGWSYGQHLRAAHRLAGIESRSGEPTALSYRLNYEIGEVSGVSRLASVQECGADGRCYPPSTFTYTPETSGWQTQGLAVPAALQDSEGRARGQLADINGDGWTDWVVAVRDVNGSETRETWLNGPSGFSEAGGYRLPVALFDNTTGETLSDARLVDVNGDGAPDVVQARRTGSGTQIATWLNTGAGWQSTGQYTMPAVFLDTTGSQAEGRAQLVELNGDGRPDVVVATRSANGVETRTAWLNTGNGWVASSAFTPPSLMVDYAGHPDGLMQADLADLNGDGLADWVLSQKSAAGTLQHVWLNTGQGWLLSDTWALPGAMFDYTASPQGVPEGELVDINGDGLADWVAAVNRANGQVSRAAWINTGAGWQQDNGYTPPTALVRQRSDGFLEALGSLLDLNGDGRPEFVQSYLNSAGNLVEEVWRQTDNGWQTGSDHGFPIPLFQLHATRGSTGFAQSADLDGDGLPELFTAQQNASNTVYSQGGLTNGHVPGGLESVRNGLQVQTRLEWGITTDSDLYTPTPFADRQWPVVANNAPVAVIRRAETQNGVGGWNGASHHYTHALVNIAGRGGLGFGSHRVTDEQSGMTVATTFSQQWPFVGMTLTSQKTLGSHVLSESASQLAQRALSAWGTVFPYASGSIQHQYTRNTDGSVTLLTTTEQSVQVDDYGNTTDETQTVSGVGGDVWTTHKATVFDNREATWILGLPTQTSVTLSKAGQPDQTTTVSAAYNVQGQATEEILNPGDALSTTTTYAYDGFGNRTSVSIRASNDSTAAARTTTTAYSSDGRFPVTVTNPLGHSASSIYDERFGVPTRTTDANGMVKTFTYDGFGTRLKETVVSDQPEFTDGHEVAIPHWCDDNVCPPHALYFIAALNDQGEAQEYAYYDAWEHLLRKTTHGFSGLTIFQDMTYDAAGRKIAETRPYYENTTPAQTTIEYDVLGRAIRETGPDGGVTTLAYQGPTVITTNANQQTRQVTSNAQGKPVQSVDALNGITTYAYDAAGNLTRTTDPQNNAIVNQYDRYGHKVAMQDPDMGHWTYTYDAFGNLIGQTDANGQTVTLHYDQLNRLLSRAEPEGITTWNYDSAPHGLGRLAAVVGPNGYRRDMAYDRYGRVVKTTVAYGGGSYVTETGYQGTSERLDWVKYPTGLVVHQTYAENGYPKSLESIDLGAYQGYQQLVDAALQAQYDYDSLLAFHQPELDWLQAEYDRLYDLTATTRAQLAAAQALYAQESDFAQRAYDKYVEHDGWRGKYEDEYDIWRDIYDGHILNAQTYAATQQNYLNQLYAKQAEYQAKYNLYLSNYNNAQTWYGYAHSKAVEAQSLVDAANYYASQGDEANANYYAGLAEEAAAKAESNQIKADDYMSAATTYYSQYQTLLGQANDLANQANYWGGRVSAENLAASQYEEKVTFYARLVDSHTLVANGFVERYNGHLEAAEQQGGKWRKESDLETGEACIEPANDQGVCLIENGVVQNLMADADYQALLYIRGHYDDLIEIINTAAAALNEAVTAANTRHDEIFNAGDTSTYWEATAYHADGQLAAFTLGNGVETTVAEDSRGRISGIQTQTPYRDPSNMGDNGMVQSAGYTYDAIGNLTSRDDAASEIYETFSYDPLNRLVQSNLSGPGADLYQLVGQASVSYQYDAIGNLIHKGDTGSYTYGGNAGPHAVSAISDAGITDGLNTSFSYDGNGNQLTGNGKVIQYSSFNKPIQIQGGGGTSTLDYGPERQLIRQTESDSGDDTLIVNGLFEVATKNGVREYRHHLVVGDRDIAIARTGDGVNGDKLVPKGVNYLHRDHLHSVVAVTDETGKVVERKHFDAFGKERTGLGSPTLLGMPGFTGHRSLTSVALVHMGGRVYDPQVGRFLSADPHIQSPISSQSFNRYSYVMNNPLSYNDPSGYFSLNPFKALKKLFKAVARLVQAVVKVVAKVVRAVGKVVKQVVRAVKKYWKVIVAAAIVIVAPYVAPQVFAALGAVEGGVLLASATTLTATGALVTGAIAGGLSGLVMTGSLKGAIIGAVTGAAFAGVGNYFSTGQVTGKVAANHVGGAAASGAFNPAKSFAHAVVGGFSSRLSGGSFKAGFLSGGFTQAFAGSISQINVGNTAASYYSMGSRLLRGVAGAVVGGISSKLAGGSFEQGAKIGFWSRMLNEELGSRMTEASYRKAGFVKMNGQWVHRSMVGTRAIWGDSADNNRTMTGDDVSRGLSFAANTATAFGAVFSGFGAGALAARFGYAGLAGSLGSLMTNSSPRPEDYASTALSVTNQVVGHGMPNAANAMLGGMEAAVGFGMMSGGRGCNYCEDMDVAP